MSTDGFWRTGVVRALVNAHDVGGVIRMAREQHGWRQADLGAAAGYSGSTISRMETRPVTDLDKLRKVLGVLGAPTNLLVALLLPGSPPEVTVVGETPVVEEDPMRRRSLLAAGLAAVPAAALARVDAALALPEPAQDARSGELVARLRHAHARYDAGELGPLVEDLPALIAAAQHTALTGTRAEHVAQASGAYAFASNALNKVGAAGPCRLTADRAVQLAAQADDPLARARADRALSIALRHEGKPGLAEQVTLRGIDALEGTGLRTRAQVETCAQMMCTAAYNAAQARDRARSLELVAAAERAARRLPAGTSRMGAAHVTLYRVSVLWALGDTGTALEAGQGLRDGMFPTLERRARYRTDLARVQWDLGRPAATAEQLLRAARHAPAEVRDRPSISRIATRLVQQHPHTPGARELAAVLTLR
ncbi:helix-turn-helix domain-containing protein [Spirillospora sp. CA-253888]